MVHDHDTYGPVQRLFLQCVLFQQPGKLASSTFTTGPCLSEKAAIELYKNVFELVTEDEAPSAQELKEKYYQHAQLLDDMLKQSCDWQWRSSIDPVLSFEADDDADESHFRVWSLVGMHAADDSIAQLATLMSPAALIFVKRLLRSLVMAPKLQFTLSTTEIENLARDEKVATLVKLKLAEVEPLLQTLERDQWLTKLQSKWTLGARTLIELRSYLRNECPVSRLSDCVSCSQLMTLGYSCSKRPECLRRIHVHCLKRVKRANLKNLCSCSCGGQWVELEEEVDGDVEDDEVVEPIAGANVADVENDIEDSTQPPAAMHASQPVLQQSDKEPSPRRSTRARKLDSDEEEALPRRTKQSLTQISDEEEDALPRRPKRSRAL